MGKKLKIFSLERRRSLILSPLRLVMIVTVSVFVTETLIMMMIERIGGIPMVTEIVLDASILSLMIFLVLYVFLFKPLSLLVDEFQLNEEQLKGYQNHLEQMVQERSRDLEDTTRRLQKEYEENIKAHTALIESEDRFRKIFEQSEDAIVLFKAHDATVIDMNPTAELVFHRHKDDVLGGDLHSLCQSAGHAHLKSVLQQIASDNIGGVLEEFECTVAPGDVRILSFQGKRINLQGAEVVYTTFRDITTRVRMEEEAREIQGRLIQANRMTTLGTLVSSVAHEINNPNNFLLLNAGIIKLAWKDIAPVVEEHFEREGDFAVAQSTWSEARTFLPDVIDGIQDGALRISEIVDNLNKFGRDDRVQIDARADANAVVQLSIAILSQVISKSTRKFRLDLAEGLPQVRGSARQLEQVVINLIQNALQSLPDPDHGILVATGIDPENGDVLIRVADEGKGIPPEIARRVMEPFFTTRLEHGGTGLGLTISSTIVKEHDGSIEFVSETGKGTTFTVRLRRAGSSGTITTCEGHHESN